MNILYAPLLGILLVLPLFFLGKKKKEYKKEFLFIFLLYFLLDSLLTALPIELPNFDYVGFSMNWSGKLNSYVLAALFFILYRGIPIEEYGFKRRQNPDSKPFALRVFAAFFLFMIVYSFVFGTYTGGWENFLFQLTMPCIIEEVTYRGVLLTLLGRIFQPNMRLGKIHFGMGVVITAILFGLWHGLSITNDFQISIAWLPFVFTGLIGFVLALVKERTGSLVYPILIHIVINLTPQLMGYIL